MKNLEEAAERNLPENHAWWCYNEKTGKCVDGYNREQMLNMFKTGAQWQKEKFIKKACEWINENAFKYICDFDYKGVKLTSLDESIIEDFKKYMKGE